MKQAIYEPLATAVLLAATLVAAPAPAEKPGGVLRMPMIDGPAEGDLHRWNPHAIDTTQWYPTVMLKDYTVGLTVSENGLDDPDQQFYENFSCGAERNYTGYCMPRSTS